MIEQESKEEFEESEEELQPWIRKAQDLIRKNNLLGRLDITHKNDSSLFVSYFAIRLIRARDYDVTKLLNPYSFKTIKANLLRSQFDHAALVYEKSSNQILLDHLSVSNREHVEEHYISLEQKNKARAIELAVNALCAQVLTFDENKAKSEFKPSRKILKAWAETWKDQIMQYNNPVKKA